MKSGFIAVLLKLLTVVQLVRPHAIFHTLLVHQGGDDNYAEAAAFRDMLLKKIDNTGTEEDIFRFAEEVTSKMIRTHLFIQFACLFLTPLDLVL
jgi:hypothetical protein